jgi:flagellar basal-body rod protein FlgC
MTAPRFPSPPPSPAPLAPVQPSFRTLAIAASGLTAQRARMDVIATNVANAETTRMPDGSPYRRRVVEMEPFAAQEFRSALDIARDPVADISRSMPGAAAIGSEPEPFGVRVRGIVEDATPGPRVYEPGHPDADGDGYVTYPNVRITDELVELMDARQLYEALASVFLVTKSILRRSIDI